MSVNGGVVSVRIRYARHQGELVPRELLDRPAEQWPFNHKQLKCEDCDASIEAVIRHQRAGRSVHGHFRLRKGQQHAADCRFNVETRLRILAADYPDVGDVLDGVFRLDLRSPRPDAASGAGDDSSSPDEGGSATRTEYGSSGQTIARSLQAASQIRRVIHDFDEDPDAATYFKGVYEGKVYRWEHFFFDSQKDTKRLTREINKGKSGSVHPLVVRGTVMFRDTPKKGRGVALVLKADQQAKWPSSTKGVKVVIRSEVAGHLPYDKGDTIIAYGRWGRFSPDGGKNDEAQLWTHDPRNATRD